MVGHRSQPHCHRERQSAAGGARRLRCVVGQLSCDHRERDSAAQIRINTTTTTASLIEDAFAPLYTTKENQDVWHIGLAKPEDLPEDEYRRFDMLMFRMFYSYQVCVVQYDDGVINDDQFNASSYYFRHLFRTPGGRRWWSETNSAFSERMRYHLEVNAGA